MPWCSRAPALQPALYRALLDAETLRETRFNTRTGWSPKPRWQSSRDDGARAADPETSTLRRLKRHDAAPAESANAKPQSASLHPRPHESERRTPADKAPSVPPSPAEVRRQLR